MSEYKEVEAALPSSSSSSPSSSSSSPLLGIVIEALGLSLETVVVARVGRVGSSWDEKGSNDGASSIDLIPNTTEGYGTKQQQRRDLKMGWIVHDPFNHGPPYEMSIRLIRNPNNNPKNNNNKKGRSFSSFFSSSSGGGGIGLIGEAKLTLGSPQQKNHVHIAIKSGSTVAGSLKVMVGTGYSFLRNDHHISTPLPRTYPCGTNHFGMNPNPPIPPSLITLSNLTNCILWGETHEPMKTWVAIHFLYHDVPYRDGALLQQQEGRQFKDWRGMEVEPHDSGAKSGYGTAYMDQLVSNAVPMLEIKIPSSSSSSSSSGKRHTRIIADGSIINQHIIPPLWGSHELTDHVIYWERKIAYQFIPAMWREYTGTDYTRIFKRTACNYPWIFKGRFSPVMNFPLNMGRKIMLDEMKTIQSYVGGTNMSIDGSISMEEIYTEFYHDMISKKGEEGEGEEQCADYMGGNEPGPTDLSFYGINVLHYVTDIGPGRQLIKKVGLKPWMDRMLTIVPPSICLAMRFFGPSMDGWMGGWLVEPPQFDPVRIPPPPSS